MFDLKCDTKFDYENWIKGLNYLVEKAKAPAVVNEKLMKQLTIDTVFRSQSTTNATDILSDLLSLNKVEEENVSPRKRWKFKNLDKHAFASVSIESKQTQVILIRP